MTEQTIYPEIEEYLAAQLEGGLFVDISLTGISGKYYTFRKDWYAVENGVVYEVGDGRKYATGDTMLNVETDCKRVGKYKPDEIHKTLTKTFTYSELRKLLKM